MTKVRKIDITHHVTCDDCELDVFASNVSMALKQARAHVKKTGHSCSVTIQSKAIKEE